MDLTWVSDKHGWALAAIPCGKEFCPRLATTTTTDGGRTWTALPAPPGRVVGPGGTSGCARAGCVSQVRFATATVGYLFGPALFQTIDGGHRWHRVQGRPVEALEPAAGTVVRIVYDHTGCPGPCNRVVQETAAGSATWHTLLRLPPATTLGGVAAQVIRQGTSVIVPIYGNAAGGAGSATTMIFTSADGGAAWQRRPDPCQGISQQEYDTRGLAAAPGGFAAVLCLPRSGTGATFVRTSANNGSAWGPARPVPGGAGDRLDLIAAASAAHLVLATAGATGQSPASYELLASADGGLHWSIGAKGTAQLDSLAPAAAFLGFEDARVGRWISDGRDIWTTQDSGQHWQHQALP